MNTLHIVMAMKPVNDKKVDNVLEHGVLGLNISSAKIDLLPGSIGPKRFPADILFYHSEDCQGQCSPTCPVKKLDDQSGWLSGAKNTKPSIHQNNISDIFIYKPFISEPAIDPGGYASRFFKVLNETDVTLTRHIKAENPVVIEQMELDI